MTLAEPVRLVLLDDARYIGGPKRGGPESLAAVVHFVEPKGEAVVVRITRRCAATGHLAILLTGLLLSSCRATMSLHDAVIRGEVPRIDACMRRGTSVNAQDDQGNTPLHYAYYHGQQDIIDRLIAYGADLTIRNNDGDLPPEMRELGRADGLLTSGALLLDRQGNWTDETRARPIYDELKQMSGDLVTKAIVRKVRRDENRLRVLLLAVKLGIAGSEARLNDLLQACGDKSMAEDYLNSGSPVLYEGGKRWAESRGYTIGAGTGSHRVSWGRF